MTTNNTTADITIVAPLVPPVPTMSQWATIALAGLLMMAGYFALTRRGVMPTARLVTENFMNRRHPALIALSGLALLLCGASPASAQTAQAPSLGTAAPFTVLGANGTPTVGTVTCTNTGPGSTINGNVGTTFTSITNTGCTISGSTTAPVASGVVTDFNSAFTAIDTQNPNCTGTIPTVSTTLTPGVYCSAAGTDLPAVFRTS